MSKRFVLVAGLLLLSGGFLILSRGWYPGVRGEGRGPAGDSRLGLVSGLPPSPSAPAAIVSAAVPSSAPSAARQPFSREFDPAVNPYAGGLRQPGEARRAWERDFLERLTNASSNSPIRFELTDGIVASGLVKITRTRDGQLSYVSGELTAPEPGKFFFLAPPPGGRAGKAVGVVEFLNSNTAYRIEPTGPNGDPELWKRRLDEVLCQTMPLMDPEAAQDTAESVPLRPDAAPDYAPVYNDNIISLQSCPGSPAVLLLDFFGGYTPTWGGVTYPRPSVSNAQIKDLWKRVAEDYLPFNINVTTDIRVYENASVASRQRCVFSPSISAMPAGAAGVAYVGSWNWGSDTVCWSIYTCGKSGAEVGSHESGHTLGLSHQGSATTGYYLGQGSGVTSWAPIMGAGYYKNVTSWAKGEYQDANNHEDELGLITSQNNNVSFRGDDTGGSLANSRYLEIFPGGAASAEGLIERTGDTDAFQFTTAGGQFSLTATPVGDWANLALSATLVNAANTIVASNNPQTVLSATISATLDAGTYTFRVAGAGRNNTLTDGFSAYGSLGYYSIAGSVAGARLPTRLSVAEHALIGTLVGWVPPDSTNSSLVYSIVSGNTGNTFAIDNQGNLTVANNGLLDYASLARGTTSAVQFELFVDITDLADPAGTELNRRVVVSVLDVNDAPVVNGLAVSVLEHTRPGTPVCSLPAEDPDCAQQLSFAIVGGNPNGAFAVDQTGLITVAGTLDAASQNAYTLAVAVSDNVVGGAMTSTGYVAITVVTNRTPFQPGAVNYALYDGIGSGTAVSDLTGSARWPQDPGSELQRLTFEGLSNRADNFGAAMRGYLIPPESGTYRFWIASDDSSELWFSAGTNSATLTRIARVNGYTAPHQWTKYSAQQSASLTLAAGQGYYIEARMKDGSGDDHLAVAWCGPGTGYQTNIIGGLYLAPFPMNYFPHANGFTATVRQGAFTGTPIGRIAVSDVNVGDALTFSITGGNNAGLFEVDKKSGVVFVVDENALASAAAGTYNLTVTVTDSGSPPLSTTATASINVLGSNSVPALKLRREIWGGIGSGTSVGDLTNNPAFPGRPDKFEELTSFASALDTADNYGSRIRAYLTPTVSGEYRFFISSDDTSMLLLSPDDNPANAARVAFVAGSTSVNAWSKTAQQMTAPKSLTAGQRYYIEAIHKEAFGADHVEVAWTGPGIVDASGNLATNIIGGSFLTPLDLNYPPSVADQSMQVFSSVPNGIAIGRIVAQDSPLDTLAFKILEGNTNNTFAIDAATGTISVRDNALIANGTVTSFLLQIMVQDSGCGGLYYPQSAQALVTIRVLQPTGVPFVWTGTADTNDWASPGNWGGAVPSAGARLIFGYPWHQVSFNNVLASADWVRLTNGGFTISGNTLSLDSGLTNSGDNTWGLSTLLSSPQTWLNAGGILSVTGAIHNAGFTLALVANADTRLSGPISGAGGLTKNGAARLILQGVHTYSGPTVVAAAGGTTTALEVGAADLDISMSDLTLDGRMDLGNHNAAIGALNGNGIVFVNDLTRTLSLGGNGHAGSFSGTLQDGESAAGVTLNVVKTGAGTQVFRGANSYSGITAVAGGTLLISSPTALGSSVAGTVVAEGATLSLSNNITAGNEPLTLAGSGFEGAGALRNESGTNSFNGTLSLSDAATISAAAGRLSLGGAWNTAGNLSTISLDAAAGAEILVAGGIEGAGPLVKIGAGTAVLCGTNNYTGLTTVSQGALALGRAGSSRCSGGFIVAGGTVLDISAVDGGWTLLSAQVLQGEGTVVGAATIYGSILPGNPVGTLGFNGDAKLCGSLNLDIAKSGTSLTHDTLRCSGKLTPGGALTVVNIGPDALALGDAFKILDADNFVPGVFASVSLPSLAEGLAWDTSTLNVDGTLRVIQTAPPNVSVHIATTGAAASLTISWPDEYSGYILQAQTNGLGSQWFPVPGVISNGMVIPIDRANASAFYRLVRP